MTGSRRTVVKFTVFALVMVVLTAFLFAIFGGLPGAVAFAYWVSLQLLSG